MLGLHWSTEQDKMYVSTPKVDLKRNVSRRYIASIVAKTFDLLGWFTPTTLSAKLLLQETWIMKINWDEPLPESMQDRWQACARELPAITKHPIPRRIGRKEDAVSLQLHGLSDASTLAYGGVVYLRAAYNNSTVSVNLIASKSRVAPIKTLTVPRLELCGALRLARLLHSVARDFNLSKEAVYTWCDSSTVLGWLHKATTRLSVFVAHRVEINALVERDKWRYVNTSTNPADLLSRGLLSQALLHNELWWNGPSWLILDSDCWPRRRDINMERDLPELKHTVLSVRPATEEYGLWCSSFTKLVRVTAWIFRWFDKARKVITSRSLKLWELRRAKTCLFQQSQSQSYGEVCASLRKGHTLSLSNSLSSLSPYLDEDSLLRVGGRQQKAELKTAMTHPIILDSSSHIVKLFVRHTHRMLLHAGPSTMLSTLTQGYHIPRLKRLLRYFSRSCVICQRAYARTNAPLMGELPASRTRPARPFSTLRLDFVGPFKVKQGNPRKPTLVKVYTCVFICFSTRAVHFELVMDLSTNAFLASLSCFTARRGLPSDIYSDNGKNFQGTHSELKTIIDLIKSEEICDSIVQWTAKRDISWHFSPARAPHFGGLWESAVKSMKLILRKTVGEQTLTYEELLTVITELKPS